ncbi:MAG: hypothetical protein PHY09_00845 [Desulfuromonadaceae bacterium]|nr:hypothetical protein [Desulfuromonadaceae bacterium]
MAFSFIDDAAQRAPAPRFRFIDDNQLQNPPIHAKPKGMLESAADTIIGAGSRMAQGVNESLDSINDAFGLDSSIYKEGAHYWGDKAEAAGSSGLPAKIYQGIGAAPAGVAEFMGNVPYAAAKGAAEGYREGGAPGALEKAAIEGVKRLGIGKVFHGIENTGISALPKAAAMGSTMGVQTAAEQAMTEGGIQPQDVAASAITGTLLSVNGGGKAEIIRKNLIKEGVQPDIARDLASRAQESIVPESNTPENSGGRFRFVDEVAPKEPTELDQAVQHNKSLWQSGQRGLMQNTGVSDAQFQDSLLKQYRAAQERGTSAAAVLPAANEPLIDQISTEPVQVKTPEARYRFVDQQDNLISPISGNTNIPIKTSPISEKDNSGYVPVSEIETVAPSVTKPGKVEQFTATTRKRGGQEIFDVKLNPSQQRTLEAVRQDISDGEAGGRASIYNEQAPGATTVSWGSSFPEYFQDKGYSKKQVISAIDNIINGEGVTANQRIMVEDLHQAKRQQETNMILTERAKPAEVPAYHLDEGDTLKRNGEVFKVTEVSPDGVTLKDGVTFDLNHEQAINFDRGTLKDADGKQKKINSEAVNPDDPFKFPSSNAGKSRITNSVGSEKGDLNIVPYKKTLYRGTADRDPLHSGGIGKGVYFSSEKDIAKSYAEDFSDAPGKVTAHDIVLNKPFYAESLDTVFNVLPETERNPLQVRPGESINDAEIRRQKQITDILIDQGYDGIVLRESLNPRTGEYVPADEVVVFPSKSSRDVKAINTPLDAAAHEAATSPHNNIPEPTQAQIEAGNYKKGHVNLHGLNISIENPAGSLRKGVDETGRAWETELAHHYGYIKGVLGADKDHLDVFIGRDDQSGKVYVVDQVNTKTSAYDESKVMIGFGSPAAARDGYLMNYDKTGPQRIGTISEVSVEQFKQWLKEDNTKKPFASPKKVSQTNEAARQKAAETLNSVYPEGSPDIGLAVKPGVKRDDTVKIPQQHIDKSGNFSSVDPQVEQRWKAANGLSDGPSLLERTKAFIHRMLSETRHFPELEDSSFADKRTADILRRFESSAVAVKAKTAEYLHALTATFGPKKMDIFTRKVILDDLMNEADKGRGLPFGYTLESLQTDHAAVSKIVSANSDIMAAIRRRADVNKALVMDLVDNDLLPVESVLKPDALPHYQKTGKYHSDDINTTYFRHQVLEYANARRWAGVSTAGDVRNKQRGWQKGRQGSELDINSNFLEAEFEVFSQGLKELATKKTLDEVLKLNDLVPELKAQAKKEGAEWKDLIPETHTVWQPERGSIFYRGQTLPEQIVTKFLAENPNFADIAKKFKEVTIMGGKKTEVVIPKGLAKTLDSLRTDRESATLDTVNQKMLGAWKIWTLLSPRRAIKYNLNNMSGDLDAAVAADPGIVIKHFNTAWKNAWSRKAGRAMTKDEIDMLDRGVIDSGISINEIPDINKLPGFSRLSDAERQQKFIAALRSGDLSKLAPPNIIQKYFYWVSGLSQLREGLLREAAYLRAKELLEKGKKVYWASKPSEIDALIDVKDKAAKLSRELLGDYGNLSAHGEKIRTRFIPFFSWMEINAPRYYRLFQNAATKGEAGSTAARMAGVGTRKVAGAVLGIAEKVMLTQVLFATVSAFNHLVHPDEEDLLNESDQQQLHVILGTKTNGNIMTARFQGAFPDALAWFGLEDYPETLRKLKNGEMESGELAKKMLMATPNKLANASAPFFKLAGELITGKSIYPDITKPVPIRDKVEHAARFLALENEYKAMKGKPSRGYLDSLKGLYLYENDPGEAAYNNIRRLAIKHLEKSGKEPVAAEPTSRSNALYYYKQALRYGDAEAAGKYKDEYLAAGGTLQGIGKSIGKAHPMAMLPLSERAKFRQSLSAQDLETLTRGIDWYRQVYTSQ